MLSRLDRWMKITTFYTFLQNGLASRVASNGELPKWEFQGEAKLKFFLFNLEPIVKNQMFRTKSFLLKVFWGDRLRQHQPKIFVFFEAMQQQHRNQISIRL